jgi:hypothetical protein
LVIVTASPLCVAVPFHALVIFWSPGKVNFSVHPLIADEPVLVIVTPARGWASLTPQMGYVVQPVPLTANAVGAALLLL